MIARKVWHRTHGRWNPGWEARLAGFRALAAGSAEAFARWQAQATVDHVAWAVEHLPWFQERAPGAERLQDLPILTREGLQDGLEALRDPTRPTSDMRLDSSGGSTGQPVRFYNDEAYDVATFATENLLHEWWGVKPWDRLAVVWGDDRDDSDVPLRARVHDHLLGRIHLNAFQVDEAKLAAFAKQLRKFRPVILQGYATALELLADYLAKNGGAGFRPKVIRSAAETLTPRQRERIESVFDQRMIDVYGSRESASLAAQCRVGGFHVLAHGKVIEIVDDEGAPTAPGTPGRVLVTDLTNRAFGLIRYANGDVASWAPGGACACGCPYPTLARVHGRTSDFITTPAGLRIHGEWFTHLFYGRDDVRRFQVRQTALDQVTLITEGPIGAEAVEPLLAQMRSRLGDGVIVTWEAVDAIPLTPSGKHRFTVSDVPFLSEAS